MSSKTIQIASIHRGPVRLSTRRDENRTIKFEETNEPGIFVTMADEDEAEILLEIGRPGYWKPGVDADAGSDINATDSGQVTESGPDSNSGKEDDDADDHADKSDIAEGAEADLTGDDAGTTGDAAGENRENSGDKTADEEIKRQLPCSFKHKGAGKYEVLDANGVLVVGGLTKEEAEVKTVELNTPE